MAVTLEPTERDLSDELSVLGVEEIRVGHRTVLAVTGELDIATAPVLRGAVDRVMESAAVELWIDLNQVTFMDSTGLRVMLDAQRRVKLHSKSLAVICRPGPVRRVFGLSRVDEALTIHASRSAAHAAG